MPCACSTTQSMHAGERLDVGGLDRREHRRSAAGCGRACGRARRRRCRWRAASRRPARRRRRRRSRSCRRRASAWPGRRRTASRTTLPRPSRRGGRRGRGRALDAPVEAAVGEHPVELVGEQQQRRDRGRVVGLVLARVVERRGEREELRDPAVRRGDLARCARCAAGLSSASHRPPSEAKRLLRREVVGVGLRGVERQAAGAGGGVDRGRARRRVRRALRPATITPVEVSLCAQATHVGAGSRDRRGRVAGLGLRRRSGPARNGAPRGDLGELRARTRRKTRCSARSRTSPNVGGVPERGRAAVAERDLVAVGQRRTARAGRRARGRRASLTGFWRCEVPMSAAPAPARRGELLGADLRRAAAEAAVGGLEVLGDRERLGRRGCVGHLGGFRSGLGEAVLGCGCPGVRLVLLRRSPVVKSTRYTPVATAGPRIADGVARAWRGRALAVGRSAARARFAGRAPPGGGKASADDARPPRGSPATRSSVPPSLGAGLLCRPRATAGLRRSGVAVRRKQCASLRVCIARIRHALLANRGVPRRSRSAGRVGCRARRGCGVVRVAG